MYDLFEAKYAAVVAHQPLSVLIDPLVGQRRKVVNLSRGPLIHGELPSRVAIKVEPCMVDPQEYEVLPVPEVERFVRVGVRCLGGAPDAVEDVQKLQMREAVELSATSESMDPIRLG